MSLDCRLPAFFALLSATTSAWAQVPPGPTDELYTRMATAYGNYDPALIRSVYDKDATAIEIASGYPSAIRHGEANIAWFEHMFAAEKARGNRISISFRLSNRFTSNSEIFDTGVYRYTVSAAGRDPQLAFGKFAVIAKQSAPGKWVMVSDISAAGTAADYEDIAGSALPKSADQLTGSYYDRFTGNYGAANGCNYRVTRSAIRLFLMDECSGKWRALDRKSGTRWEAGDTVISTGPATSAVNFSESAGEVKLLIETLQASGLSAASASRIPSYSTSPAAFKSADGTQLSGTVYSPLKKAINKAVVVIHGSGPQDRHGYASLIDVIGQRFLAHGFTVLTFDKRGTGGSGGDWSAASFATLAEDVATGRNFLARRGNGKLQVGLAGSSQAGWIAAKAVERDPAIPFVVLFGAAGSALTVPEQNNYYTANAMRCARVDEGRIGQVVAQANLFFATKKDHAKAAELAKLTGQLSADKTIAEYLMPDHIDSSPNVWYMALETDYDPAPAWKSFRGRALFAFGGADDSTPGKLAADRTRGYRNPRIATVFSPNAQHLGLIARDTCSAELKGVSELDKGYWDPVDAWLRREAARP